MKTSHAASIFFALATTTDTGDAFSTSASYDRLASAVTLRSTSNDNDGANSSSLTILDRRMALSKAATTATAAGVFSWGSGLAPANALVKGVAPPPKKSTGDKPKCTNVEECQALAEQREAEKRAQEESGPPPLVTKGGIKYRDLEAGDTKLDEEGNDISVIAKEGDNVSVYFKVLKLGKRSYDGISGEGTVVFSRGYGLEDDEDKAGTKSFQTTVGAFQNIAALNEALVGMKVNGMRRFAILPQKGWEKATAACDGGPGGGGAGGDIRTDYVVVPTATMVQQEACFDTNKLPFPATYAQQRRMAQRFDQSLIMEVQLVSINN